MCSNSINDNRDNDYSCTDYNMNNSAPGRGSHDPNVTKYVDLKIQHGCQTIILLLFTIIVTLIVKYFFTKAPTTPLRRRRRVCGPAPRERSAGLSRAPNTPNLPNNIIPTKIV